MSRRLTSLVATIVLTTLGVALPAAASADSPAWHLSLTAFPSNFAPGATAADDTQYQIVAYNLGAVPSAGTTTITDTLPPGITPVGAEGGGSGTGLGRDDSCSIAAQTVTCTNADPITPGHSLYLEIKVDVDGGLAEGSTLTNSVDISGGGAASASVSTDTAVSSTSLPLDFTSGRSGLGASLTDADGNAVTQAGSHPFQLAVDLNFNAAHAGQGPDRTFVGADGGLRDVHSYLPAGLIVDPQATPVKCTEAQLETLVGLSSSCPAASQVGMAQLEVGLVTGIVIDSQPLYNMVAPPGRASDFAFDALGFGFFTHIFGGLRAGDYRLSAATNDVLAKYVDPIFGAGVQLWGDPSSSAFDYMREPCVNSTNPTDTCPITGTPSTPLLTMPTSCGSELTIDGDVDSWGHPGEFVSRSAPLTDATGNPTPVAGCSSLEFNPTLSARPTTNLADAPSGLEADLKIPFSDSFNTLATAHLRKAVVALPPGLVLNPSSANGLEGCSSAQVGIDPGTGVADGNQPSCPDASRIGDVEVDTPLLDHPLQGSVYVATPHDNPFDSLLAIYVVFDDPPSGTLIKLAGHVEADPQTGQLTTTFDNNPQLPFSEFKLHFKSGANGVLRTPTTCGEYSTDSELTPWSAPESGPPATSKDTYAISQGPNGGACATSEGEEPNSPTFDAGTVTPIAAAYSPFVLHLSRGDGSQTFASLALSPPPGLLAKLAGTPYCPDAALKAAEEKSGAQEKANPSCPAASKIGVATVGAGAGPAPYYTQGNAYLAPPYKGAPLSVAIVTPAAAGPYDLGTVVVRSAVRLDPESGQITATSDPIPQILQGIPLDVRSIVLSLDKPSFTLNGTSCDPFAVTGSLTSGLGQIAPLSQRFQLAECGRLAFKPKLSIALKGKTNRGGHPALRATLAFPSGASANIARASVALPRSEFLAQGHIGTICTRVQFAAAQCPAGSVYGSATATTPLLDYALEGPVYLRSSDHELPDLVVALHGPPSQPVEVDAIGRIDSIKGGIRTTFEAVPDAPISSFTLQMPGAAKSLLENSTDICASVNRATVQLDGQNGKVADSRPALKVAGCKGKAHKKHRHKRRR
jgi:hypothetical protein